MIGFWCRVNLQMCLDLRSADTLMMIEQVQEQLSVTKGKKEWRVIWPNWNLFVRSSEGSTPNWYWWMVRNCAWKPIINCEFSSKSRQEKMIFFPNNIRDFVIVKLKAFLGSENPSFYICKVVIICVEAFASQTPLWEYGASAADIIDTFSSPD